MSNAVRIVTPDGEIVELTVAQVEDIVQQAVAVVLDDNESPSTDELYEALSSYGVISPFTVLDT